MCGTIMQFPQTFLLCHNLDILQIGHPQSYMYLSAYKNYWSLSCWTYRSSLSVKIWWSPKTLIWIISHWKAIFHQVKRVFWGVCATVWSTLTLPTSVQRPWWIPGLSPCEMWVDNILLNCSFICLKLAWSFTCWCKSKTFPE